MVATPDGEAPADEVVVIAPVIHIPERGLGEAEDGSTPPAKKRTRRGSRGGRNRKKSAAVTTGAAAAIEVAEPASEPAVQAVQVAEPSENGSGGPEDDWTYTPMSEWGMDER